MSASQELPAGGRHRFAHGEGGGDGNAAGVDNGVLPRVVEVEAVGESGVGEHGVGGGHPAGAADECALRGTAEPRGGGEYSAPEVFLRGGERVAQRVEGQQGGVRHDGGRDLVQLEADREAREAPGRGELRHGEGSIDRGARCQRRSDA
jgi:hypothetical protein